jgi:hypothetical protein
LIGVSAPVFVVGTLLLLLFGVLWGILPATGYVAFGDDPARHLKHLILPSVTLATLETAIVLRMTRSSMLEVLAEDYVRTARAKGLDGRLVLYGHALRNALIPVLTIIGIQIGSALGGTVLVELIFNWPGLSSYLVTGINQRDYPVVQAVVLVIAALFILLNLLTDLIYAVVDPRIRYARDDARRTVRMPGTERAAPGGPAPGRSTTAAPTLRPPAIAPRRPDHRPRPPQFDPPPPARQPAGRRLGGGAAGDHRRRPLRPLADAPRTRW